MLLVAQKGYILPSVFHVLLKNVSSFNFIDPYVFTSTDNNDWSLRFAIKCGDSLLDNVESIKP